MADKHSKQMPKISDENTGATIKELNDIIISGYIHDIKSSQIPREIIDLSILFYMNGYRFDDYKTGILIEDTSGDVPVPLPKEFTIMGYAYPERIQTDTMIASRDQCAVGENQFRFQINDNYIGLWIAGGPECAHPSQYNIDVPCADGNGWKTSLTTTEPLKIQQFTHVTLVVTRKTSAIYLNGKLNVEKPNGNENGINHNSNITFRIGSRHKGRYSKAMLNQFQGVLRQFIFYNYALDQQEINNVKRYYEMNIN